MSTHFQDVAALLQEVRELPNPDRSILTHNERVLIEFCQRLGRAPQHLAEGQDSFQNRHQAWLDHVCAEDPTDLAERVARFGEEALELQQALGQTLGEAIQLAEYVHGRAVGEPEQEMGGAFTTMAGLASFVGLDMAACAEAELARVSAPAMIAKIREKRSKRHGRGPLPGIHEPDFIPRNPGDQQ